MAQPTNLKTSSQLFSLVEEASGFGAVLLHSFCILFTTPLFLPQFRGIQVVLVVLGLVSSLQLPH